MRVGVMTVLYHDLELTEALDRIAALGVRSVELATGNYVGNAHADPARLLADDGALEALRDALDEREMTISALSQHGNPLHPDPAIASAHHETWRRTLELAQRLERRHDRRLQRLPRRRPGRAAAELGHLPVAAGLPRDPRVAVDRARDPVLARGGRARPRGRRADRVRDAPRDDRLQPGELLPPAGRGRRRRRRLQLRPEPPLLAGHRRRRGGQGDRPGRRARPRPRQGHRPGRAQRRPSTASSTPSPTSRCSTAPGSSAPSATATARTSGAAC